jgi:hypothetical protein
MSEEVHGFESGNSPPPKGGRMTNEQREAQEQLLTLGRYRIKSGSDGWPFIPGEYGRVEWDCGFQVFTDRRRLIPKLLAIPGVSRYQMGDTETTMLLRPDAIKPVLDLIQAKRRRAADSAQHLASHAYRGTTAGPKPTGAVGVPR